MNKIIDDILEYDNSRRSSSQNMEIRVRRLKSFLNGKRYFLVLDDVWEDIMAEWRSLRNMLAVGKTREYNFVHHKK